MAWCGFPVLHNVRDSSGVGMVYTTFDEAAALLPTCAGVALKDGAYMEKNREALEALLPPRAQGFVQTLLREMAELPPTVMRLRHEASH